MRWAKLVVGEIVLLFASVLVFRSAWTLRMSTQANPGCG